MSIKLIEVGQESKLRGTPLGHVACRECYQEVDGIRSFYRIPEEEDLWICDYCLHTVRTKEMRARLKKVNALFSL